MAAGFYTVRDIVEAAIEKEIKRRNFYATVTELSSNPDIKGLFHFLTEEEDKHAAIITKIRDRLPYRIEPEKYPSDSGDYIGSIVDEKLYSEMDSREFVQQAIDSWNIFRLAIGFEKDAILFFMEFLPRLTKADKKVVGNLIKQEKGHIRKLVEVMEQIG
jgi:rubrerythrin